MSKPVLNEALENFDRLPNSAYVKVAVVQGLFACSRSSVLRHVAAGTLPAPREFGDNRLFNVGELRAVLHSKEPIPLPMVAEQTEQN
ncbi:conserved hypothetical protein [Paraburkholderia ribeironis]|uniref:Uncharacterized protein n=1 Tax=Paraburkholderia ribeironis TaxID=1247936 RepID=A0A1N7RJK3_9BURK|nr:hypothetical protein [Paraburkholderia ribeironis]SIT35283.1 conserved hypothetical protein [Paraburkholderia ribeironis]